ncbi:MAG: Flp pilus assembly complex ATPase component TadA [Armatimonadetes bacterium]|nr:Flp pilus assembly complex ATPase component TadA [Armatimonadota bacterium]
MTAPPESLARLLVPPDDFDARPAIEELIRVAAEERSSDLHLRPGPAEVEVLMRTDGVLRHRFSLDRQVYARLLVGLKNMARLASYKKSMPQDGQLRVDGLEVRVATAPTHFGEKAIFRLLARRDVVPELEELGFWADEMRQLQTILSQPQGLLLATGPAGSGKTTTLLCAMRWLYAQHRERLKPARGATLNIVTLEDPIEVVVPEFTQTEVRAAIGMTFATGLRSLLRQDPEVILVGEIRDPETASAVVQASLTGHLVLSNLHTRDTVGVIPRLLEMGAEPYQLAAMLSGVVYQRLVRRLCPNCSRPADPTPELARERQMLGLPEEPHFVSEGCIECHRDRLPGASACGQCRWGCC